MIPASTRKVPKSTRGVGESDTIAHAAKMPIGNSLDAMIDTIPVLNLGLAKLMSDVGNRIPMIENIRAYGHISGFQNEMEYVSGLMIDVMASPPNDSIKVLTAVGCVVAMVPEQYRKSA